MLLDLIKVHLIMYKWVKTSEEHTTTHKREGILSTDHDANGKGRQFGIKGTQSTGQACWASEWRLRYHEHGLGLNPNPSWLLSETLRMWPAHITICRQVFKSLWLTERNADLKEGVLNSSGNMPD